MTPRPPPGEGGRIFVYHLFACIVDGIGQDEKPWPDQSGSNVRSVETTGLGLGHIGAYFRAGYTSLANGRQRGEGNVKRDRSVRTKVSELDK